jgi:chemotaxis protein methyltransferase CheR
VIENFYDRLVDGGYLLLGHAESLINISTAFNLKHLRHDMVYQKPPQQDMR